MGLYLFLIPTIYFIFFQILGILAHPFAAIILFSIVLFLLIKYFKFKKTYRSLNISIFFIFLFLIFYLPLYIADTNTDLISWILHPNIKFYKVNPQADSCKDAISTPVKEWADCKDQNGQQIVKYIDYTTLDKMLGK